MSRPRTPKCYQKNNWHIRKVELLKLSLFNLNFNYNWSCFIKKIIISGRIMFTFWLDIPSVIKNISMKKNWSSFLVYQLIVTSGFLHVLHVFWRGIWICSFAAEFRCKASCLGSTKMILLANRERHNSTSWQTKEWMDLCCWYLRVRVHP